jgi:UDPglucose--hexose-1-phosphate uridylyltransferase
VFCEGNEDKTPPEILAGRPPESPPDGPGWTYRVVSNKFPVLRIEGDLEPSGEGLFDRMNGVGAHEVVLESPDHGASLATMSTEAVADVLLAYRERVLDLKKDPRFEYVLVFKNYGEAAGASLEHPHSQLIATPIIPIMVVEELGGSARYWEMKERCVWCDILRQERRAGGRVILEFNGFAAVAPFAPRFPFETWILPARHRSSFEESEIDELRKLAAVLREFFRRLGAALHDPPFNFMLHTAPLREPTLDYFHWHLEIIPKLTRVAGFEWGTGFFINPVPPEDAATALRDVAAVGGS